MLADKRAMSPPPIPKPMPKPVPKPTGGAPKPGGSSGGGGGGGIGDMLGGGGGGNPMEMLGQIQQMSNPMEQVKGLGRTNAGDTIKSNKEKIEQFKQSLENINAQIKQTEQQIDSVGSQISQAKKAGADTTGLSQQEQQLKQQLISLEEDRKKIETAISELESANSKLRENVWQERKANAVGMIGPEGMAAAAVVNEVAGARDSKIEGKTSNAVQAAEGAAEKAGSELLPSSPSPSFSPSSGGAPSSGGSGGGITSHLPKVGLLGGDKGSSGKKGPVLGIITMLVGSLASVFSFKSQGMEGLLTILPVVLLAVGIAFLIPSKGKSIPGWIMLVLGTGVFIFRSGGVSAGLSSIPVLIPLFLLVAILIVLDKTKDNRGMGTWMIIIVLAVPALWLSITHTGPYLMANIQAQGGVAASLEKTSSDVSTSSQKGISGIMQDAVTSYNRQMAVARGENIDGDVDQTVKEEVGIEILPPYLPNPKKLNLDEAQQSLEFGARIKGFDPKTPITATSLCHIQSRDASTSVTTRTGPDLSPGEQQRLRPQTTEGYNFDTDVTCYPTVTTCGNYIITISTQADRLRTDAQMTNHIIDRTVLNQRLRSYAESKESELKSTAQVNSAINDIYKGQVGDFKSVSQKGAIKVVMATQPITLIGVDQDTDLTFRAGVENAMGGWIRSINRVEITIPGYFRPLPEFCDNWDYQAGGNKIILKESYLNAADFDELPRGQQKVFPSCHLIPSGDYQLTEPTEATFLALVDYNYIVQDKNTLEVRTNDGEICRDQGSTGSGSNPSSQPVASADGDAAAAPAAPAASAPASA